MEQIIPILIAVVVFAFQAYSNYQKEQEKARKRKFGQPIPDDTIPVEVPVEQAPKQAKRIAATRHIEKTTHVEKTMRADLTKKLELSDLDGDNGGQANAWHHEFDLREAVINSVILERPSY